MKLDLHSRISDFPNLTILDIMLLNQQIALSKKITINKKEFSELTGKPERRINALLNSKLIPERAIVGGYSNRKQRTKIMFYTEEILKWLKGI